MQFDWDAANISHIARHDVTPEEAEQVLISDPIDMEIVLRRGEFRLVQIGQTFAMRVLVVVSTERNGMNRVVTARPAHRTERDFYSETKGGR